MMHHLVIGPRRAVTACKIRVSAYYPMSHTALPEDLGEIIDCCVEPDNFNIEITCPKCRKASGRSDRDTATSQGK